MILRRTAHPTGTPARGRQLAAAGLVTALLCTTAGPAFGTPYTPPTRTSAPNTDECPHESTPPKPVSTSEELRPGQVAPTIPPVVPNEFGSCGVTSPPNFILPKTTASAWMVFNLDTGEVYATKDPHGRYRPASVIKVLLAMLALNELDMDKLYTATYDDENQIGSAVGLKEGLVYTNRQLMYGLLLNSGNDAAHALAAQLGTDEQVVRKINELAKELGATDTYAASYSGLDAPGMMSSAHDLALFYKAAWSNPVFADMLATEYIEYPGPAQTGTYQVWNDNGLFMYDEDGIGGKTGYTDDANHTFVGAKKFGTTRIAAVILDSTIDEGRPWEQAQKLIDAANASGRTIGALEARRTPDPSLTPESPVPSESAGASASAQPTSGGSANATHAAQGFGWRSIAITVLGMVAFVAIGLLVWRLGRPRRNQR